MARITIDIKSCEQCPHFKEGPTESTDGFDRGNDWICTHPSNKKPKRIAAFVEWHDTVPIPKWCPAK